MTIHAEGLVIASANYGLVEVRSRSEAALRFLAIEGWWVFRETVKTLSPIYFFVHLSAAQG